MAPAPTPQRRSRRPHLLRSRRLLRCPHARAIPTLWGSAAWSRSTPPAAQALASSTSRLMISFAKVRWCWPSTMGPGRKTLRQCLPRSRRTAPRRSSSRSEGRCNIHGKTVSVEYDPKDEIEKGISAVHWAVGGPTAPYFRFPALRQPPELIEYLGKRNIGIFSADMDSFDFKMRKPEQVRQSVLAKLKEHGKGIVL